MLSPSPVAATSRRPVGQSRVADLDLDVLQQSERVDGQQTATVALSLMRRTISDSCCRSSSYVEIESWGWSDMAKPRPGEPQEGLAAQVTHALDHLRVGNPEAHELVAALVQAHGADRVSKALDAQLGR
jgi:hypothetical protein